MKIDTELVRLAIARSGLPSPLKSATIPSSGPLPSSNVAGVPNVKSPFPG